MLGRILLRPESTQLYKNMQLHDTETTCFHKNISMEWLVGWHNVCNKRVVLISS